MSAMRSRRRRISSQSNEKSTEETRESSSQPLLTGDENMKYTNGQLVWSKFESFPWWPGAVVLSQEDDGQSKVTIRWFGNAGEKSNECVRKNIIPFDPALKEEISKEVKTRDLVLFGESVDEALQASKDTSTSRRRSSRRRSLPGVSTNGESVETSTPTEQDVQTGPPSKRLRRRSVVSSNQAPKTEEITPAAATPSPIKRRRLSRQTPQQPTSSSKKVSFAQGSVQIPDVTATGDETQTKENENEQQQEQEQEKENSPEAKPGGRRRSIRILGEMSVKRKRCLEMTTNTHEPDDLSVFIAHQYYSYLEDGKTPLDALSLVAQKWEMKNDAVLEHLDACEFESNKPQNKRARRGA